MADLLPDDVKKKLFILIGMGLCAAAIAVGNSRREFLRRSTAADGVVIRLFAGSSHPEIEFQAVSGRTIEYFQGGFIHGYHQGDRVRVRYDPSDPAKTACLDAVGALWFVTIFLFTMGVFFIIVALISYL